ncbi:MAG: hypothetical protein ACPG7F_01525 [Aggregatilineales bacterium]
MTRKMSLQKIVQFVGTQHAASAALITFFFVIISITTAQSPQINPIPPIDETVFPAYPALENTVPPRIDRYDLAWRFWQIEPASRVIETTPPQIGQRDIFNVNRSDTNSMIPVDATLLAIGQHSVIYVESNAITSETQSQAENFARTFDEQIYQQSRLLWGEDPAPGIDNDARIYILFTAQTNPGTAAYFSSRHLYPSEIVTGSNQHELLIFNINAYDSIDHPDASGTAAHEFQHMIRYHQEGTVPGWMDEGYSMFTEHHLGFENNQWAMSAFMAAPGTQLNSWRDGVSKTPHYGAGMMLISYFFERFGEAGVQALSENPATGMQALVNTLAEQGISWEHFLADWSLANLLQEDVLPYGYPVMWQTMDTPLIADTAIQYPYQYSGNLAQFGTDYLILDDLPAQREFEISMLMPGIVSVLDMMIARDDAFYYAPPLDNSNASLTRRIDLRDIQTATLSFDVWHDLEQFWDYAYLSVSTDDGASWTVLQTAAMNAENPNGRGYVPGYTGSSEGWIHEAIALDAFIGQEIMLRFEVAMDDSTHNPGFALDNITIPEIGYSDDSSRPDEIWQAAGFTRITNQLPQRTWLQVVQHQSDGSRTVTRHFLIGADTRPLTLLPDTEQVTLAIMPVTRFTEIPMPYLLQVVPISQ